MRATVAELAAKDTRMDELYSVLNARKNTEGAFAPQLTAAAEDMDWQEEDQRCEENVVPNISDRVSRCSRRLLLRCPLSSPPLL